MALFHHFITSADLGGSQKHMQTQLSQLGFTFHYVLRLLLAFSAFHLARHSTNDSLLGSRTELYALAEQHYEIAVREVTEAIPHLDTTTSPALYASSIFIFLCSLAKGPQPGEYLAYRDDGLTAQEKASAVLLYSTSASHCNYTVTNDAAAQYTNVFTLLNPAFAESLRVQLSRQNGNGSLSIVYNMSFVGTVTPSTQDGSTDSPNTGAFVSLLEARLLLTN